MRYSYNYKRKAVELYRQGLWPDTPDGLNTKDFRKMIRSWVRIEESCGPDALRHKSQNKEWTPEERYTLVARVLAGDSIKNVAYTLNEVPYKSYFNFDYGGRIFCLACGREVDSYMDGSLCGECCGSVLSCTCCGEGLNEDNAYYDEDGNPYCEDCFNRNFAYDDIYDCYIPVESAVYFQVVTDDLTVVSQYVTDEANLYSCKTWMDSDGMTTMRLCDMSQDFFLAIANQWLSTAAYEFKRLRYSYYSCETPEETKKQKAKISQMYDDLFHGVTDQMQDYVDNNPYVRTITPMEHRDVRPVFESEPCELEF